MTRLATLLLFASLPFCIHCDGDDPDGEARVLESATSLCEKSCGQITDACEGNVAVCRLDCEMSLASELKECVPAQRNWWNCLEAADISCAGPGRPSQQTCSKPFNALAECHAEYGEQED